mmetsp:Transcript_47582/g.115921  ORF Transcript_47582/g.115921 Transcript_47582/m.115921 type:complete len:106 (-) Transcript_47582:239-556(-)
MEANDDDADEGATDDNDDDDDDEEEEADDDDNALLSIPLLLIPGGWKYPNRLSSLVREQQCIFVFEIVDFDSTEANDDDMVAAAVDVETVVAVDASMDVDGAEAR